MEPIICYFCGGCAWNTTDDDPDHPFCDDCGRFAHESEPGETEEDDASDDLETRMAKALRRGDNKLGT